MTNQVSNHKSSFQITNQVQNQFVFKSHMPNPHVTDPSVPGVVNKCQEVLGYPMHTDGIFRLPPVFLNITDISTVKKDEENSTRCHQNANTRPGYHQRNGQVCRESSGNSLHFSLGSSALHSPTIQDECSPPSPIPATESSILVQHKSETG